ncbi:MAG: HAD family phosphatase [Anaerolineae bacterium]|nr:HAD family phosphatase [Anaerolineae bacterium]
MPIEAVIFDMDVVLVDSEVYWIQSRQEFAQALGKVWTLEDQRLAMGRNTIEWAQVMQERLHLDMSLEAIIADVKRRVMAHYDERLPVLPGALEAVAAAAQGYRIALASGSPKEIIDHVMRLTGLDRVFEFIVYADDMPNGKPAPDVYLETARLLDVPPGACVGIEDSINGVWSLHNAGMRIIAVPSPAFPLPEPVAALAHRLLPSLASFSLDLVRSLDDF